MRQSPSLQIPIKQILTSVLPVSVLLVLSFALLASCGQDDASNSQKADGTAVNDAAVEKSNVNISVLQVIKGRGKLIVLTTNTPTTYYFDRDNQATGPEYDMTQSFARSLQVDVEYKIYDSIEELITALRNNEGDVAAAGLTVNNHRKEEFDFGPVYQQTKEYLVCHRDKKAIFSESNIGIHKIYIAADSSFIESIKEYPEARWQAVEKTSTVGLIKQVASKKIDCTISDSILFDIERRYHTEIQNKYTLARHSDLAWMLKRQDKDLKQAIENWFAQYKKDSELAYLMEKYYGYTEIFDYVDTHKFLKRVKSRLPKYEAFFIDAASTHDIEPSLLAAQSYQESHWNRKAKSPTGVRGIMMLTQPVAKSLGVTNRLNAKQNIYAGAKFQAKMKKMVEHVEEPTRSWLALAAYNVGRGHFRDAQSLAKKLNKNPDYWHDMKEVLPLLSQKDYYKDLRYGYARGEEPVRYVERIRNYEELLQRHFNGVNKKPDK